MHSLSLTCSALPLITSMECCLAPSAYRSVLLSDVEDDETELPLINDNECLVCDCNCCSATRPTAVVIGLAPAVFELMLGLRSFLCWTVLKLPR